MIGMNGKNLIFFEIFDIIYVENEKEMNFENFIKSVLQPCEERLTNVARAPRNS